MLECMEEGFRVTVIQGHHLLLGIRGFGEVVEVSLM